MVAILGIGPLEWIVLLGGAVLLFGGDLPTATRKAARVIGRLRATAQDLAREIDITDATRIEPDEEPWTAERGADAEARLGPPLDQTHGHPLVDREPETAPPLDAPEPSSPDESMPSDASREAENARSDETDGPTDAGGPTRDDSPAEDDSAQRDA